jgi:GxxExxY protein
LLLFTKHLRNFATEFTENTERKRIVKQHSTQMLVFAFSVNSVNSAAKIKNKNMDDLLTRKIIGAAIEVHRELGRGLLESIYEEALCHEFGLRGIKFQRQVEIDIIYKGKIIKGQRIDLIVEDEVIVEIKSLVRVPEAATAQVLSYLRATRLKRALLINFGLSTLIDGVKRFSL